MLPERQKHLYKSMQTGWFQNRLLQTTKPYNLQKLGGNTSRSSSFAFSKVKEKYSQSFLEITRN